MKRMPARDRPTRLLFVAHFLDRGGLEQVVKTLARDLPGRGYAIAVAYAKGGRTSEELAKDPGITMIHYDASGRLDRFRKLIAGARAFRPDIVHTHFSWYGPLTGLLCGAKRVETIHNLYDWFKGPYRLSYSILLLLNQKVVAVSRFVADFNRRYFPFFPAGRLVVIPNGVDLPSVPPGLPASMRAATGDFTACFVGRLAPQKGLEHLLRAARLLEERGRQFRLILAGEGPEEEKLRALAAGLRLAGAEFAGYREDVRSLLAGCDIFVLPSHYEGMPLSVIEAMAAGLPVVATPVGGVPEVVEDGVTGLLVPVGDPEALSAAIEKLAASPELRLRMGKCGQERAYALFGAPRMVDETDLLYRTLLGKPTSMHKAGAQKQG